MKVNYEGHDRAYQNLRRDGAVGWDRTQDAYVGRIAQFRTLVNRGFLPATGRMLELGCGAGNMAMALSCLGYDVYGIDISRTAVEWANERSRKAGLGSRFMHGNVLDLATSPCEKCDIVLDGHCFHCIVGSDRGRFLAGAYRILKPSGVLVIDTMCGPVDAATLEGYDSQSQCTVCRGIATRYFGSQDSIKAEIQDAGFTVRYEEISSEGGSHGNMIIIAQQGGQPDAFGAGYL